MDRTLRKSEPIATGNNGEAGEIIQVDKGRKRVTVFCWGKQPMANFVHPHTLERIPIPDQFKCQTKVSGVLATAETKVENGQVFFRFSHKAVAGDWELASLTSLNSLMKKIGNPKHNWKMNALLCVGVTYPNLQARIHEELGLEYVPVTARPRKRQINPRKRQTKRVKQSTTAVEPRPACSVSDDDMVEEMPADEEVPNAVDNHTTAFDEPFDEWEYDQEGVLTDADLAWLETYVSANAEEIRAEVTTSACDLKTVPYAKEDLLKEEEQVIANLGAGFIDDEFLIYLGLSH